MALNFELNMNTIPAFLSQSYPFFCMSQKFTLLEIICTITIMLILTCIAVPIFIKVKGMSTSIGCTSHLRSLGIGFAQYAADNRNLLPHHDDGLDVPPTGFVWYKMVLPYLLAEDAENAKYRQETGLDTNETDISKIVFSYKMNSHLEEYKGKKTFFSPPFRDISTIRYPSKTVLIFDGRTDKKPISSQPYGPPTYVEPRHNNRAGILFLDWTVKMVDGELSDTGYWKNGSGLIWDPDFEN
jgi:prepilin-type processing-associated H-X9-DG protein